MDPYATLGVPASADAREIKRAWRKIARQCHPDRVEASGVTGTKAERLAARFREARAAWEILGDEDKRATHDAQVAQARRQAAEDARRRREAREAAQRRWEALQAERARDERRRQAQQAELAVQAAQVAAYQAELDAWMRQAERKERAHAQIQRIETARRVDTGQRLLLAGGRAVATGIDRVRATLASMMLEDL
jgi:curved DNA-binding protein CbpA